MWVKEASAVALGCGVKTSSSTENETFSFSFCKLFVFFFFFGSLGFEDRWKAEEESKEYRTLGVGWARRLRKLNSHF